jgi:hypothetical protein
MICLPQPLSLWISRTRKKIPDRLAQDFRIVLDEDRELFAGFLKLLSKHIAGADGYSTLIAYADKLIERGQLDNLTREMQQVAENTKALASYMKLIKAQWRLSDDDESALSKYLELGRKEWGGLMLPMIRHRTGDHQNYKLKQVFVPLFLQDKRSEEEVQKKMERLQRKPENIAREDDERSSSVSFTELISRHTAVVLIGKPGSGKTTLFRRAALAFAEGRADKDLDWKGKPLFPIFIRLRNFGEFLNSPAQYLNICARGIRPMGTWI